MTNTLIPQRNERMNEPVLASDEVTPEFLGVGVSTPLRAPRQELESRELTPFQESTPPWS